MTIAQIFARAENDVIGNNNDLPWHLPKDMKFFKTRTLGHPMIMGRKTFESLGKPLPGRTNIIISANPAFKPEGCMVFTGFEEALANALKIDPIEVLVIGGSTIFTASLPFVNKIYLTEIKASVPGNIKYSFDKSLWKETSREDHFKDDKHAFDYSFVVLEKA